MGQLQQVGFANFVVESMQRYTEQDGACVGKLCYWGLWEMPEIASQGQQTEQLQGVGCSHLEALSSACVKC